MVKKILVDGSPCKKCGEVLAKMEADDQLKFINDVLIADERDAESAGMQLAKKLNVDRAPFFVVTQDDGSQTIYTVYLKFVKDVLNKVVSEKEELQELLQNSPDLDFL
jgi:hypothetical protein